MGRRKTSPKTQGFVVCMASLCVLVMMAKLSSAFAPRIPSMATFPQSIYIFPHSESSSHSNDGADHEAPQTPKKEPPPPPSRVESIVYNAKLLSPIQAAVPLNPSKPSPTTEPSSTQSSKNKYIIASTSGLAVALAMIPEAVAFSFVAGVNPLVGLWTTVTLGFVAAATGGRPGICSSASGACSVVVAALCRSHGPAYLSACAILAGLLQVVGGAVGLGKCIRLVPHPVMLGFVNGLAILMTKSQLVHLRGANIATFGIAGLTMGLVKLLPRFTTVLPPTLGAVALATLVTRIFQLPLTTLADIAGASTFAGGWNVLPRFGVPLGVPWTWATLQTIFPYAATMAAVGCIESLLTMQLLDGMMNSNDASAPTERSSTRRECIGQGLGNTVSGLFGGIGGCALLGQSIINVQSGGGVSRWSGMSMALFLGTGIVLAAPILGRVPLASLVGVMLLVCQSTFSWSSLRILRKIPTLDAIVIALVSGVTVQRDLAQAVLAGTVASALGFAWKQSTNISASTHDYYNDAESKEGACKEYKLRGPIFFGSTGKFTSLFQPNTDPDRVILDFANSRVMDHSALVAIQSVVDQYGASGKMVFLRRLSDDCTQRIAKLHSGGQLPPYEVVQGDPLVDPVYQVA